MTSTAVDPITALLWDSSLPCQAIIHNRNTGHTTRSSPSGSCFFTAHRLGYLSYSIRMILEHFYDKNQPLSISIGSNNAKFWFSVEVPSATAIMEEEDGDEAGKGGNTGKNGPQTQQTIGTAANRAGIAAAKKRSSLRINEYRPPASSSTVRDGVSAAALQNLGGGGGGASSAGAGTGGGSVGGQRSIPVSCSKPFYVLVDELKCQLHYEADARQFNLQQQQEQQSRQNGGGGGGGADSQSASSGSLPRYVATKVLLDLPLKLVLNIDDAPPSNILSLNSAIFERESNMLLRQYQKMNCVRLFGSVKPFLMLDPSSTQMLEDGCKRGDADSYVHARSQIYSKATFDIGGTHQASSSTTNERHPHTSMNEKGGVTNGNEGVGDGEGYGEGTIMGASGTADATAGTSGGSGTVRRGGGHTERTSISRQTTTAPCVFCFHVNGRGMATRCVPADSPLARLGDVLRAFIITFADLADEQISEDETAPRSMGRVFICGIEPSMCLPTDVIASTMTGLDFAVHVVVDTRSAHFFRSSHNDNVNSSPASSAGAEGGVAGAMGMAVSSSDPWAIVRPKPLVLATDPSPTSSPLSPQKN